MKKNQKTEGWIPTLPFMSCESLGKLPFPVLFSSSVALYQSGMAVVRIKHDDVHGEWKVPAAQLVTGSEQTGVE